MPDSYVARFVMSGRHWLVSIPVLKDCRVQARTLAEGRRKIRRALSLHDAEAKILEDIVLPRSADTVVRKCRSAAARLEKQKRAYKEAMERVVILLNGKMGLGVRDVAEIVGLSYQRVHQLLKEIKRSNKQEAKGTDNES